ncbi:hypothetical protein E3J84_03955 [Candidatus Aerophobetes bacterium]|uniref:Uncharacterized protein n=1 Tax=Aerophobetes bacterium TaxID=2030807 RepID=A0A523RXJ2_UNCAE|nr:MAG: hypothetical protein E3J84_03955 [Candidatus Aerophobetes bacterium]
MSMKTTVDAWNVELLKALVAMEGSNNLPFFNKAEKGRLRFVDDFPCVFYWYEGNIPMGGTYLDGDLIKLPVTVGGFDYSLEDLNNYELAETRSEEIAYALRDELGKWEHRNLSGTIAELQVTDVFIDPGIAPFMFESSGLMAAGGVELLVTWRQPRGS